MLTQKFSPKAGTQRPCPLAVQFYLFCALPFPSAAQGLRRPDFGIPSTKCYCQSPKILVSSRSREGTHHGRPGLPTCAPRRRRASVRSCKSCSAHILSTCALPKLRPAFNGTKVTLRSVFGSLATGDTPEAILHDPSLTREDIQAAIAFTADEDCPYQPFCEQSEAQ